MSCQLLNIPLLCYVQILKEKKIILTFCIKYLIDYKSLVY